MFQIDAVLPLKPLQRSMMYRYCSSENSTAFYELYVYHINGEIDLSLLKLAIYHIDRNRDVMRSIFLWKNTKQFLQVIRSDKQTKFSMLDASKTLDCWIQQIWCKHLDLSSSPYEVYWYPVNKNESYLLVKTHHILIDGWSQSIWANELMNFYHMLLQGEPPQIFVVEYEKYLAEYIKNTQKNKSYWRNKLLDFPIRSNYLATKPSPQIFTMKFNKLFQKITSYSEKVAVSFSSYVYTAWAIFLSIQKNNRHVAFYITLSGRENIPAKFSDVMGMFINVIPISVMLKQKTEVLRIIKDIHEDCLDSMFHQEIDLMETLMETPEAHQPEISSTIDLQTYPIFIKKENSVFSMEVCNHLFECHDDLLLAVRKQNDDLVLELIYNLNRFGEGFGEYTCKLMGKILEQMLNADITYDAILNRWRNGCESF